MLGKTGSPWQTPLLILDKSVKNEYSYVSFDMLDTMMRFFNRQQKVKSVASFYKLLNYLYVHKL